MANDMLRSSAAKVEERLKDVKIENLVGERPQTLDLSPLRAGRFLPGSPTRLPNKNGTSSSSSHGPREPDSEMMGGDISIKVEPGLTMPKLVRSSAQEVKSRQCSLFHHLPDATAEATATFKLITECTYSTKYLGDTEHAMECDCAEEWDASTKANLACGDDSDCINRATKMECFGDCGCGSLCQNQRFQRQQYAKVSVIRTEKKGHGLRADAELQPGEFIYEYIGEVIHEGQFRKRMMQYDEEGIKHFYFMSLSRGEFVDATKKGNLGRFCNHSCSPNCYVDKWVVGNKLRMGIFAERKISAGEELVFNYNVDRYGADPQPCYCGEPNCTGFIGGKTQTERATKLPNATIEALGIDGGDGWDTAVAKRPRKKKAGEDDEEYVNNVQPRSLDEDSVTKVMATLMQCKEKWIAVKLLGRIQRCDDEKVMNRVIKMHGYQILNSALSTWKEDYNVVLQILDIMNRFPRLTKNKITDSKIEGTVESLSSCEDDRVRGQAAALLQEWSTLETAYRIPRKKRDPAAMSESQNRFDRRDATRDDKRGHSKSRSRSRSKSRSRSLDAPRGPSAPTGPRSSQPQRAFFQSTRTSFRPSRPFGQLPSGWFAASSNGRTYYYNSRGETTWQKPTAPTTEPPPPPKPNPANKALDDIINEITSAKSKTPERVPSASATPKAESEEAKPHKRGSKEKWRCLTEEKQRKLYENTLFPHVKHVADKYKGKLPRDDIKRFFKEVTKKLVNSDYKNHRVEDPTKISTKQEKNVKKYAKDYFDKAVAKKAEHDTRKSEARASGDTQRPSSGIPPDIQAQGGDESDQGGQEDISDGATDKDDVMNSATPVTPLDQSAGGDGLKRKRDDATNCVDIEEDGATPSKRARSVTPPYPPPPPPPRAELFAGDEDSIEEHAEVDAIGSYRASSAGNQQNESEDSMVAPAPPVPNLSPARSSSTSHSGPYMGSTLLGSAGNSDTVSQRDGKMGGIRTNGVVHLKEQEAS